MARKKENMNLATEIICDIKRRLIICRIALAVSLAGNAIMAAMLICKQSRHGAAGVKACCLFLLPAILLQVQHIICGNVGKCWLFPLQAAEAAVMQNSCKQWDIRIMPGVYKHYTRGRKCGKCAKVRTKKESLQKFAQKRNRTESDTKKSLCTRYARAGKTFIFRAMLNFFAR